MKVTREYKIKWMILGIILFSAVLRLGWVLYSPTLPHQDFAAYQTLAVTVADGHGYSGTAGATAFRPPGYPLFLAAIYFFFGKSLLFAKFSNVALGIGSTYLTYRLMSEVFSKKVGIVAGLIVAFFPSLILYTSILATENLATFLMLLGLYWLIFALKSEQKWLFILSGMAFGLTALTRPNFLVLPPLIFLALFFRRAWGLSWIIFRGLLLAGGMLLVILPWSVRNYISLGHIIPISTNGGFNLLISFSEESTGAYIGGITENVFNAPFDWNAYRIIGPDWNEYELDRAAYAEAFKYMRSNPDRVLSLAPIKLFNLLRDDVSGVYQNAHVALRPIPNMIQLFLKITAQLYYMGIVALTLLTIMFHRVIRKYSFHIILLTTLMFMFFLHVFFHAADRFHLPFLPIAAGFSAFTITSFANDHAKSLVEFLRRYKVVPSPFQINEN